MDYYYKTFKEPSTTHSGGGGVGGVGGLYAINEGKSCLMPLGEI